MNKGHRKQWSKGEPIRFANSDRVSYPAWDDRRTSSSGKELNTSLVSSDDSFEIYTADLSNKSTPPLTSAERERESIMRPNGANYVVEKTSVTTSQRKSRRHHSSTGVIIKPHEHHQNSNSNNNHRKSMSLNSSLESKPTRVNHSYQPHHHNHSKGKNGKLQYLLYRKDELIDDQQVVLLFEQIWLKCLYSSSSGYVSWLVDSSPDDTLTAAAGFELAYFNCYTRKLVTDEVIRSLGLEVLQIADSPTLTSTTASSSHLEKWKVCYVDHETNQSYWLPTDLADPERLYFLTPFFWNDSVCDPRDESNEEDKFKWHIDASSSSLNRVVIDCNDQIVSIAFRGKVYKPPNSQHIILRNSIFMTNNGNKSTQNNMNVSLKEIKVYISTIVGKAFNGLEHLRSFEELSALLTAICPQLRIISTPVVVKNKQQQLGSSSTDWGDILKRDNFKLMREILHVSHFCCNEMETIFHSPRFLQASIIFSSELKASEHPLYLLHSIVNMCNCTLACFYDICPDSFVQFGILQSKEYMDRDLSSTGLTSAGLKSPTKTQGTILCSCCGALVGPNEFGGGELRCNHLLRSLNFFVSYLESSIRLLHHMTDQNNLPFVNEYIHRMLETNIYWCHSLTLLIKIPLVVNSNYELMNSHFGLVSELVCKKCREYGCCQGFVLGTPSSYIHPLSPPHTLNHQHGQQDDHGHNHDASSPQILEMKDAIAAIFQVIYKIQHIYCESIQKELSYWSTLLRRLFSVLLAHIHLHSKQESFKLETLKPLRVCQNWQRDDCTICKIQVPIGDIYSEYVILQMSALIKEQHNEMLKYDLKCACYYENNSNVNYLSNTTQLMNVKYFSFVTLFATISRFLSWNAWSIPSSCKGGLVEVMRICLRALLSYVQQDVDYYREGIVREHCEKHITSFSWYTSTQVRIEVGILMDFLLLLLRECNLYTELSSFDQDHVLNCLEIFVEKWEIEGGGHHHTRDRDGGRHGKGKGTSKGSPSPSPSKGKNKSASNPLEKAISILCLCYEG